MARLAEGTVSVGQLGVRCNVRVLLPITGAGTAGTDSEIGFRTNYQLKLIYHLSYEQHSQNPFYDIDHYASWLLQAHETRANQS